MKIDDLIRRNASELVAAYTDPTPTAVASEGQRQPTRLRIGVAVAAAAAVILLAAPIVLLRSGSGDNSGQFGSQATTPPPTTTAAAPTTTNGESQAADGGPESPGDLGISVEDAEETTAQVLRERLFAGVTFVLSERPGVGGRCLEVAAVIDNAVQSVGGACGLSGNPSPQAWDFARPVQFAVEGKNLLAFFGRAGSEVATVRVSGPVDATDTQVTGAWLVVVEVVGELSEVVVESFSADGTLLLSEGVPIDLTRGDAPLEVGTILDLDGLIKELQVAGAVVSQFPVDTHIGTPFRRGEPTLLCVNGLQLTVYEYHEASARAFDSLSISTDGQLEPPERPLAIEWEGQPRFFAAGRVVVLHLNADHQTIDQLTSILGPTLSPDGVDLRGGGPPPCDN